MRRRGGVSLRAGSSLGFIAGLFSGSDSEVGPLTGDRQSLLSKTGEHLRVHVPAGAFVGGPLLVDRVFLYEALYLYSNTQIRLFQKFVKNFCTGYLVWLLLLSFTGIQFVENVN